MVEPHRLSIVLGAKYTGVEEDKEDDEPEHCLKKLPSRKVWKINRGKLNQRQTYQETVIQVLRRGSTQPGTF